MSHILLVEDNAGAAVLIRRYIEKSSPKHQLAVFAKAAEALTYAGGSKVDLFILDIQLLDYRGTVLAKQLRALPEYRFTPMRLLVFLAAPCKSPATERIRCRALLSRLNHNTLSAQMCFCGVRRTPFRAFSFFAQIEGKGIRYRGDHKDNGAFLRKQRKTANLYACAVRWN